MWKQVIGLPILCLACVGPSLAEACPIINGKYSREVTVDGKRFLRSLTKFTRQAGKVFSYSNEDATTFRPADGVARPLRLGEREGTIKLSCSGNVLVEESQANNSDKVWQVTYTLLSSSELSLGSNIPGAAGLYKK